MKYDGLKMKDWNKALQNRKAFQSFVKACENEKPAQLERAAVTLAIAGKKLGNDIVDSSIAANAAAAEAAEKTADWLSNTHSLFKTQTAVQVNDKAAEIEKQLQVALNATIHDFKVLRHYAMELARTTDPRKRLQLLRELRSKINH